MALLDDASYELAERSAESRIKGWNDLPRGVHCGMSLAIALM